MELIRHTTLIDQHGRIELPRQMRDVLGLGPGTPVVVELSSRSISIRQPSEATPITQRIATMDLPVASCDEMEVEIEGEHLL